MSYFYYELNNLDINFRISWLVLLKLFRFHNTNKNNINPVKNTIYSNLISYVIR